MSPATVAWSAAWTLTAAGACVRLLRASSQPVATLRNGYRWLAVAAACLAVGGSVQLSLRGLIGGAQPLRLADLISLAALPALVIGLATLTNDGAAGEAGGAGSGRPLRVADGLMSTRPVTGLVVDSCLLVSSLFALGLLTMFGPDYATADAGRAAFVLAMIRPAADLAALGLLLQFAVRSPRRALAPLIALGVVTLGDSLAVGDRIAGKVPGIAACLCLLVALLLLALTPAGLASWTGLAAEIKAGQPAAGAGPSALAAPRPNSWSSPATITALGAAGVTALVAIGYALSGARVSTPALAVTGAVVVLLLVARLAGLVRHASQAAASAQESDWMFRALAGTTSDAVLICDLVGTIEYASTAVGEFGYVPAELTGRRLAELVHPEDRPAGIRAAITGLRAKAGTATFAGRIRGADGSWRYVESTLSRYGEAGAPARLLITTRDVSDRVALRRQVTQLAFHDGLTGLPNRAYAEERLKDLAEEAGPLIAAILIDLDGFAAVNELTGSTGADLLLAQAGRRLRAAVPPPATVARWGSDEFAIVLAELTAGREGIDVAERVAGLIAADPFAVAGKEISLTASVGVAVSGPEGADQLLGQAGIALSKAKEAGVGRMEVFAAEMHARARRKAELTRELAAAIAGHRLEIEYLPVIELATGKVRDVEARVRWPRAEEQIGPDELLGIAEEFRLVTQLGDWVLAEGCRHVAAWRAGGWEIGLSVRCAPRHVTGARFASAVIAALDEADLPPQALTLEVDERVLIDGAAPVVASLGGLRGKGIKLALASFGTGYASLANLRRSAVDVVKIDPSFVAGLDDDPTLALLTRTVVQLGHDLGMEVVAAGIERPGQREQLQEMGCPLGQGPGIAAPLAASDAGLPLVAEPGTPPAALPADR